MRDLCEIERRRLRLLHVQARFDVQHRAADAAPVEPASEIRLRQPIRRNDVANAHVRDVVTRQTRWVRAKTPLADLLPEKRSGLAPDPDVETADTLDGLVPYRHVDAERHARAEFRRRLPVVEQRDYSPQEPWR